MSKFLGNARFRIAAHILATAIALPAVADEKIAAATTPQMQGAPVETPDRVERKGLIIEFTATGRDSKRDLVEGEEAQLRFSIRDATSQQPMKGLAPGAWLDTGAVERSERASSNCKRKMEKILRGAAGDRPTVDLSAYYIVAFNRDASLSIIDPLVGFAGKTNLLATIQLPKPPADWAKSPDSRRLYVTLPESGQIAVIDAESFKVGALVDAGTRPTRIALQASGRYLWIGNDGETSDSGGVTVIDPTTMKIVARFSTGKGHHELAFSHDDRFAFVSNRERGDVSVIDIASLQRIKDIATGPAPIALASSKMAQAVYVADGVSGVVSVIQGDQPAIVSRIRAKPGLGPVGITPDGRWALVLNSKENLVHVIEISTNRLVREVAVAARPYQIAFSQAFAYVRALDSENVGMIPLSHLGEGSAAETSAFAAGALAPGSVAGLGLGASISPAVGEAAMVVANPADNLIYYYMEGMLAPSGSFRNPGHEVAAVDVIDHGLKETAPGVYTGRAKIPAAGDYDVGFMLGAPRVNECFHVRAGPSPSRIRTVHAAAIEYLDVPARATPGDVVHWRFRLKDPLSGELKTGLTDVRVLYYAAPGLSRAEAPSHEVEAGLYEAELPIRSPGAYYIYVGSSSLPLRFEETPYRNLLVQE
ncbi:YncE family protein [Methylocystis parvus]|uniref:YncE family protein n=1 Tax=Methylocystis parvus TaxID=134 RepID=UPI003C738F11